MGQWFVGIEGPTVIHVQVKHIILMIYTQAKVLSHYFNYDDFLLISNENTTFNFLED